MWIHTVNLFVKCLEVGTLCIYNPKVMWMQKSVSPTFLLFFLLMEYFPHGGFSAGDSKLVLYILHTIADADRSVCIITTIEVIHIFARGL